MTASKNVMIRAIRKNFDEGAVLCQISPFTTSNRRMQLALTAPTTLAMHC